jgi:mono/diheme cytochrome c family protein
LNTDLALHTGRTTGFGQLSAAPAADNQSGAGPLLAAEAAHFEGVVDQFPLPVDRRLVEHGRDRYMIYCTVCHDALGSGHGKIVERGYTRPPSYHVERLRRAPVGHIFRVITEGYGSMPSYAAQIPVRDRWAIVAYVRALQLSQHFPEDQLPPDMRNELHAGDKIAVDERGAP